MNSKESKLDGWAALTLLEPSASARSHAAIRDEADSRAGLRPTFSRCYEDGGDLIGAIAAELLRLRGGSLQHQLRLARHLLEAAFRSIETGVP